MIRNYIKIAIRTLWKNKKLSAINIFGLAIGMACSLLIFLYVQDELAYDKFYADADRIHRVVKDFINDDGSRIPDATTPGPLAAAMQREIPEVISITRIHPNWGGTTRIQYQDKVFSEPLVWRVDSSFFDVFSITFIKGDANTALVDINSIVLTESAVKKYFGAVDPIGKTLRLNGKDDFTVTAIIQDVPSQSHFHYDFLMSFRRLPASVDTNWGSYNYYTYVKVSTGTDIEAFNKKIQDIYHKNQNDNYSAFYTQPLVDIHLNSKLKWELEANGDKLYVYIFMIVGVFILLIAGINYINLSTARSSLRAKETGVRKVSGAERSSLIAQFLLESLMLCILAAVVAVSAAYALLPYLNQITQKHLEISGNPIVAGYVVGVTIAIGILAGIFPALYLSSFRPVAVLKGFKLNERGALNLRKSLVVVQFTISITLIIGAIIVIQQVDYIQSANLGFDKDQVLIVRNANTLSRSERSSFKNSIREVAGVKAVATSGTTLGQGFSTSRLRAKGSVQGQQLNFTSVDFDYLDLLNIQMKEGRTFSPQFPADTMNNGVFRGPLDQRLGGIVINERAVKEFGLDSPAVGKQMVWSTDGDTTYYVEVIGVAKDFHFTSMRNEIKPFGFVMNPRNQGNFNVKLETKNITGTIEQIQDIWKTSFPEIPFEYTFLDETYSKMYAAEARFQTVFISLVVLGIIIACLGLFALAMFSAEQRIKEIGIRKVLGASVPHVVALLSKDFLKLVIISLILSVPIAAYVMQIWLDGFAYKVEIEWWIFACAAAIALIIAFLTVSSQALRAAMMNPSKSLRAE